MNDYKERKYLSSTEAAKYLGITVQSLHHLVKAKKLKCTLAASGQKRFDLKELKRYEKEHSNHSRNNKRKSVPTENILTINNTTQRIYVKNAMKMEDLEDNSIHLMITSPPYFNAKMYTKRPMENDLGSIHDLDEWFEKISMVWKEVFRVLQPGRKAFINIMNLPVRDNNNGFKSLNLVGRTIDVM